MDVRVSESARAAYLSLHPGSTLPEGSVIAAFHKREKSGDPGPVYVMERRENGWSYSAYQPDGRPDEHGVLTLCERCHAESPNGGLFGLPKLH